MIDETFHNFFCSIFEMDSYLNATIGIHNVDAHVSSITFTLSSSCTSISYVHNLLIFLSQIEFQCSKFASHMENFPPCSKKGILPHAWTIIVVVMRLEHIQHGNTNGNARIPLTQTLVCLLMTKLLDFKCWIKFISPIINIAPYSYTNIFTWISCILINRLQIVNIMNV